MKHKAPGILPTSAWLNKNGYSALDKTIRAYPKMFKHISQAFEGGTPLAEHIKTAKRLTKEHNGLPRPGWLAQHGYYGLLHALRHHRRTFAHIKKHPPLHKTLKEWVLIAERLTKRNRGRLPPVKWLRNNGYCGLAIRLQSNPRQFSHLAQDRAHRSPQEWIPIVEHLAKENNGVLPYRNKLRRLGYQNLPRVLTENPHLFAHIKQEGKRGHSIQDWLLIAEILAKQNQEILPTPTWCQKNGIGRGLYVALHAHPDLFAHIPRK